MTINQVLLDRTPTLLLHAIFASLVHTTNEAPCSYSKAMAQHRSSKMASCKSGQTPTIEETQYCRFGFASSDGQTLTIKMGLH